MTDCGYCRVTELFFPLPPTQSSGLPGVPGFVAGGILDDQSSQDTELEVVATVVVGSAGQLAQVVVLDGSADDEVLDNQSSHKIEINVVLGVSPGSEDQSSQATGDGDASASTGESGRQGDRFLILRFAPLPG
jgi:hypothetical protein